MPRIRPRRNRKSAAARDLCRETTLSSADLVYPVFLHEDSVDTPLESLPGQTRWCLDGLEAEVGRAAALGIRAVVLFPKIADELKTSDGREVANPDGLVPRALRRLRSAFPDLCLWTDVALDPKLAPVSRSPTKVPPSTVMPSNSGVASRASIANSLNSLYHLRRPQ